MRCATHNELVDNGLWPGTRWPPARVGPATDQPLVGETTRQALSAPTPALDVRRATTKTPATTAAPPVPAAVIQ